MTDQTFSEDLYIRYLQFQSSDHLTLAVSFLFWAEFQSTAPQRSGILHWDDNFVFQWCLASWIRLHASLKLVVRFNVFKMGSLSLMTVTSAPESNLNSHSSPSILTFADHYGLLSLISPRKFNSSEDSLFAESFCCISWTLLYLLFQQTDLKWPIVPQPKHFLSLAGHLTHMAE